MSYKNNKKWRKKHPKSFQRQKRRYYRQTAFAPNGWEEWSTSETKLAVAHIVPDKELSKILGRSVGAIQMRRHRFRERKKDSQ